MANVDVSKETIDTPAEEAATLWTQFCKEFPTKEHHLLELYRRIGDRVECKSCTGKNWRRRVNETFITCLDCRKESYPMKGSIFHRARNIRARHFAVFLREHGVFISKALFKGLVGVCYDSSWNIHAAVDMVINDHFGEDPVSVPSWEFEKIIGKRSRETPARMHPFSEQETAERELAEPPVEEPQSEALIDDLAPIQQRLYEEITDTPIHFDVLLGRLQLGVPGMGAALVMLELADLVKRLPGDWFKRTTPRRIRTGYSTNGHQAEDGKSHEICSKVSAAIDFIRETFHGVSRKYLQLYLAAFWHYVDKQRWRKGALLEACLQPRNITCETVRRYVSPLAVNLAAA